MNVKMRQNMRLAKARARYKDMLVPEHKKTLSKKLDEIVDTLGLEDPTITEVNGVKIELYPISALGQAVNRTSFTLRVWEADGIIPKATFRDKHNRRLYSALQIALVTYLAEKHDIGQGKQLRGTPFVQELKELWPKVREMVLKGK